MADSEASVRDRKIGGRVKSQKRSGIVLSLTILPLSARNALRPLVARFRQTVQSLTSAKRLNPLDTARRHSLHSVPGQE